MSDVLDRDEDDSLGRVLFALSDPTRRAIVEQLLRGPRVVGDLELPRKLAPATLSKHLAVLMDCGLLSQQSAGRTRTCKVNAAPLRVMATWVESHRPRASSQRAALERYFGVVGGQA